MGDGAFQMTGMELSTALRYGLTPIVILLNNGGYGTERPILDGTFNDIFNWNYHKLPDVLGAGVGVKVDKEQSFIEALQLAKKDINTMHLIEVVLDPYDFSETLKKLTSGLSDKV